MKGFRQCAAALLAAVCLNAPAQAVTLSIRLPLPIQPESPDLILNLVPSSPNVQLIAPGLIFPEISTDSSTQAVISGEVVPEAPADPGAVPETPEVVTPETPTDPGAVPETPEVVTPETPADPGAVPETPGEVTPEAPADPGTAPEIPGEVTPETPTDPGAVPEIPGEVTPETPTDPGAVPEIPGEVTPETPADPGTLPEIPPAEEVVSPAVVLSVTCSEPILPLCIVQNPFSDVRPLSDVLTRLSTVEAQVQLPDGTLEIITLLVDWTLPQEYPLDTSVPGSYPQTGSILLPDDTYVFAQDISPTLTLPVEVTADPFEVTSFQEAISSQTVLALPQNSDPSAALPHLPSVWECYEADGTPHLTAVQWDPSTADFSIPGVYTVFGMPELPLHGTLAAESTVPLLSAVISVQALNTPDLNAFSLMETSCFLPWVAPEGGVENGQILLSTEEGELSGEGILLDASGLTIPFHILQQGTAYQLRVVFPTCETGVLSFSFDESFSLLDYDASQRGTGFLPPPEEPLPEEAPEAPPEKLPDTAPEESDRSDREETDKEDRPSRPHKDPAPPKKDAETPSREIRGSDLLTMVSNGPAEISENRMTLLFSKESIWDLDLQEEDVLSVLLRDEGESSFSIAVTRNGEFVEEFKDLRIQIPYETQTLSPVLYLVDESGATVAQGEYEAENGGSVEVTENDDGTVTLSVSVPDGFRFVGWHDGETIISTDNPYTFVPEAGKTYTAKIEKDTTEVESRLFSTDSENAIGLLTRAYMEGLFAEFSDIKGVVLTDLRDHNLEGVKTLDYSADGDGSVLAWRTDDVLYIGGYGKIIANTSLAGAFHGGTDVEYIEGLSLLDTSNVTDMSYMFATCGWYSTRFTLDLGDNFDTSNVTTMSCMFERCGQNSLVFTLDLGDKFNTSNVTDMYGMFMLCGAFSEYFTLDLGDKFDTSNVEIMQKMFTNCGENCKVFTLNLGDKFDTSNATDMYGMFKGCGKNSEVFDVLDLSGFTVSSNVDLEEFAYNIPATTFIFGEGWKNATLPSAEVFYASSEKATTVVNAVDNLFAYDWAADNRVVTYEGTQPEEEPKYEVENGGTIDIVENEDGTVTLYVSVPDGFSFVGWHDGTKIISTDNPYTFVPEAGKTYTAKLEEIQPDPVNKYTITANATDGGVAEGTATVEEGQNVTLTAAANEGYKFIGWYDGDVLVCETEDFVVENIIANATYTARFVLVENEEPEEPDTPSIPELSFDGETLTLVDESEVALRVGVSYVGSAVFDEKNVDWDRLVYVGRKFEEINGENGYQVYENFTSRSFDKAGNYVSYVKYAIGENVSSYYYLFTVAGEADTIALPWLAFSDNTLTMVNEMKISATVGYAYVGAEVFESYKIDWDRLVEVGKNYSDINTEKGYVRIPDITEFSKEFSRDGNYVAYIKYIDPNSGKTVSEYITFTVGSAPVVTADRGRIVVEANGNELLKVTVAYIGDNDNQITDWTSFTQASNAYKEINGDPQKQQYSALKTTNRFAQEQDGYYAVYVRYTNESGEKVVRYDTVYVDNTDAIVKPAAQGSQDGNISIADEGYEILKVTIAYIGTTEKTVYDWNGFMEAANVFNDVNGDPPMQQYFNVEHGKLFKQKHDGYYLVYIRYNDSGTARSTYSTVWVDGSNIVSPEINADTGYIVLSDNGFYVQKMTIAYIGDKDKEICTWSQFMAASNVYKDINGEPQKQQYHSPSNGSEFLQSQDGWYAAYIRYIDDNGSEVVIYRTLEVKDTALATLPEAVADGADIVINCNGHEVTKATIAYIGDEEKKITNWNEFSDASNVYKDINGDPQKQQYHNPENGTAVTQDKTGYYAVYLRYIENGVAKTVYGVVYVEA